MRKLFVLLTMAIFLVVGGWTSVAWAEPSQESKCKWVLSQYDSLYDEICQAIDDEDFDKALRLCSMILECIPGDSSMKNLLEGIKYQTDISQIKAKIETEREAYHRRVAKRKAEREAAERARKAEIEAEKARKAEIETKREAKLKAKREATRLALIEKLDREVRATPASQLEENLELYIKLLGLDPDNPRYKRKVDHYRAKMFEAEKPQFEDYRWGSTVDEVKEIAVSKGLDPYFIQDLLWISPSDSYKILDEEVRMHFDFTSKTLRLYKVDLYWNSGDIGPLLYRILTKKYGKCTGRFRSICNLKGASESIHCRWKKNQVIVELFSSGSDYITLTYISCLFYDLYEEEKIEVDKDKF